MTVSSPPTIRVRVLLFARYAEILGTDALELILAEPATVASVVAALRSRRNGHLLPPHPLCAVNLRQASAATRLGSHDEIAVLPPLAGG